MALPTSRKALIMSCVEQQPATDVAYASRKSQTTTSRGCVVIAETTTNNTTHSNTRKMAMVAVDSEKKESWKDPNSWSKCAFLLFPLNHVREWNLLVPFFTRCSRSDNSTNLLIVSRPSYSCCAPIGRLYLASRKATIISKIPWW